MPFGEGNGNPLQCSCLENPRDGEAWWAAVYGVAQSRTQLKQLSSRSSTKCIAILIKNTKLFTITHIKQMGANLMKHVQDLYAENYTMLLKKIKEDLNKHIMFMD